MHKKTPIAPLHQESVQTTHLSSLKVQIICCPNPVKLDIKQPENLMAFSTNIKRYREVQIILRRSSICRQ